MRKIFDIVIDKYPETESRLASNEKSSDMGYLRVPGFNYNRITFLDMTCAEKRETSQLLKAATYAVVSSATAMSIVARAANRARASKLSQSIYMGTRLLFQTSYICERLFHKAGFTLTDRRKGIFPSNFESQELLDVNNSVWTINDANLLLKEIPLSIGF